MISVTSAFIEDLYAIEGQAELIDGKIVEMGATGFLPSLAAGEIYASLRDYGLATRSGFFFTDNMGFEVNLGERQNVPVWIWGQDEPTIVTLKRRKSFNPDVSFYRGTPPTQLGKFIQDAPTLAVEVRSENDYGDKAELAIACKIADYFEAGTSIVWDVDVLDNERIVSYRSDDPLHPIAYPREEIATAEPALSGWQFPVETLFRQWWV
jgi:Uma2 family endonuclease